jgi:UDP-3-O-[3-hydroxymyristoyl] glucosamine N-acyltransferase
MTSLVKDFIRRGGEGMRISCDREEDKIIRKNVIVHESARIYGRSEIGENSIILENVILGYPQADILKEIVKDA